MLWGFPADAMRIVLQADPFDPSPGNLSLPVIPLLVAVGVMVWLVVVVARAVVHPSAPEARRRQRSTARRTAIVAPSPKPVEEPVFKKAPVRIIFPSIRERFPDVWGVGEPFEIQIRLTDKAMARASRPAGLTVKVAGKAVDLSFARSTATLRQVFKERGEVPIVVEFKVPGEALPQRSVRTIRVVQYREEIAEVFHKFKEEASRVITHVSDDATPREVLDLLVDANPRLPADKVERIIESFEVAKFSNHPVDRTAYEEMILALLDLERVEL